MKKILVTVAAIGLSLSTAAIAQDSTPDFTKADADGNGTVSMSEAQAVWPDLTQDQFNTADANGDGSLDQGEFTALVTTMASAMSGSTDNSSSSSTTSSQ